MNALNAQFDQHAKAGEHPGQSVAPQQGRPEKTGKAPSLNVKIVQNKTDILNLETDWRALEREAPGATFFQSYDWCCNAIEHFGADQEADFRIYCVYDRQRLVAVLPLKVASRPLRKVLTGLSEPYQQYTEMLLHPDYDAKNVFGLIQKQFRFCGADLVHFGQVPDDNRLDVARSFGFQSTHEVKAAPFVQIARFQDFETYFKTIRSKTRKNMRNARNRMERVGKVSHQWTRNGPLLGDVIERTYAGRLEWQQRMGVSSRAFQDDDFKKFLSRFKAPGASGVDVLACSLTCGERFVADQWGFVFNGHYYAYISTWDTGFEDMSPGRMHLGEVIRAGFENNLDFIDFLAPDVPYKKTWATGTTGVHDLVLALTPRGRIFATVWLKWLRPLMKKTFQAVPVKFRKKLLNTLLKRN